MDSADSLTNQFLIAMPGMDDPNFSGGVALLCHHGPDGAMGLVLNRLSDFLVGEVMAQMGIREVDAELAAQPVLAGGPVDPERGFVLHSPDAGPYESTLRFSEHIHLTTSRDVLEALARGDGPRQAIIALGYAGWDAQQLEDELREHVWLSVASSPGIVFDTPLPARWDAAARLIGIDPSALTSYSGHA
ncbi:YqgE/AlgH family protein [Xanthomonadaceae bacterium XH05]|nr:YqgE/AlgH family protein [Xanthomonadaceae bacterium XH05]